MSCFFIQDFLLCRGIETESVESLGPPSITITDRAFTDSSHVRQFQREREATAYLRHMSVDERFFKGPIAVPEKVTAF
jgi:hypothetical protein